MTNKPGFFDSLFRKQPIERGVPDPLEADLDLVRVGVQKEVNNLSESIDALLDDMARRQELRRNRGHNV